MTTYRRLRPLVIAGAVLMGLVLGLGIDVARRGGWPAWLAARGLPAPYLANGAHVDVGGRSLYLDCRGSGSPLVVLEAGAGADSSTWSTVIDAIASTTRVCAYDRAGRARSDPRDRHTLADAAADLRTLLAAAGERGPIIYVGHSLGGAYARVFTASYPGEVSGVLLVDTFDPDLLADHVHPLLGSLRGEYEGELDGLRNVVAASENLDWPASELQLRAARDLGVPVEVLFAPRADPRLDAATNSAIETARIAGFETLSPGRLRYTTAHGAGHMVQFDRPDLVIESVRRLVEQARSNAMR